MAGRGLMREELLFALLMFCCVSGAAGTVLTVYDKIAAKIAQRRSGADNVRRAGRGDTHVSHYAHYPSQNKKAEVLRRLPADDTASLSACRSIDVFMKNILQNPAEG